MVAADAVHSTTIAASVDSGLQLGYLCSGDGKAVPRPLPCVCATARMGQGTGLMQGHAVMWAGVVMATTRFTDGVAPRQGKALSGDGSG